RRALSWGGAAKAGAGGEWGGGVGGAVGGVAGGAWWGVLGGGERSGATLGGGARGPAAGANRLAVGVAVGRLRPEASGGALRAVAADGGTDCAGGAGGPSAPARRQIRLGRLLPALVGYGRTRESVRHQRRPRNGPPGPSRAPSRMTRPCYHKSLWAARAAPAALNSQPERSAAVPSSVEVRVRCRPRFTLNA